ncbi:MAG TPA: arylesterase [Marinagarivorans sp.]
MNISCYIPRQHAAKGNTTVSASEAGGGQGALAGAFWRRTLVAIGALLALAVGLPTAASDLNSSEPGAGTNRNGAEQGEVVIGILGDSLSAGYGLKPKQSWPDLLAERLKGHPYHAKIINASVSGATTDAGLQMQQGLLRQQPDIVIIELGANDGLQGKPLPLIAQNLATLITNAQSAGARVLLLGVRIPPNLGRRYTEPFFTQYQTLATQHQVALVPFFLEGVAGDASLMQADGLHPNAAAQAKILGNVWPALEPLLADAHAQSAAQAIPHKSPPAAAGSKPLAGQTAAQ